MKDNVLLRPNTIDTLKKTTTQPSAIAIKRLRYAANEKLKYKQREMLIKQNEMGLIKLNINIPKIAKNYNNDVYKTIKVFEVEKSGYDGFVTGISQGKGIRIKPKETSLSEVTKENVKKKEPLASSLIKRSRSRVQANNNEILMEEAESREEIKANEDLIKEISSNGEITFNFDQLPRTPKRKHTLSSIIQEENKEAERVEKSIRIKDVIVQIIDPLTSLETVKELLNK